MKLIMLENPSREKWGLLKERNYNCINIDYTVGRTEDSNYILELLMSKNHYAIYKLTGDLLLNNYYFSINGFRFLWNQRETHVLKITEDEEILLYLSGILTNMKIINLEEHYVVTDILPANTFVAYINYDPRTINFDFVLARISLNQLNTPRKITKGHASTDLRLAPVCGRSIGISLYNLYMIEFTDEELILLKLYNTYILRLV